MKLPYKRPALNYPKQEAFIDDLARFCYVEAGTKSGKTVGMIIWIHEEMIRSKPNQDYLWIAPNSATAKIAYSRLWYEYIPNSHKKFFKKNDTERVIIYPNGGRLWFKGGDRPNMLYGQDYYAVVVDEASRVKEETFIAILSTLTNTKGPIRCIGNLKGRTNWFYREARKAKQLYEDGLMPEGCIGYHRLTSMDNPSNDLKTIEEQRGKMSEAAFNELYLAVPMDDGNNPFGSANIDMCIDEDADPRKTGYIYPAGQAKYFGVDFGSVVDYTTIIGLDDSGRVAYFERFKGDWNEVKVRVITAVGENFCLADDTGIGKAIVNEIKATRQCPMFTGFTFIGKSSKKFTKQDLMQLLAMSIAEVRIKYPKNVIHDELQSFECENTSWGMKYSAPAGQHDDCVCGLALANYCMRRQGGGLMG